MALVALSNAIRMHSSGRAGGQLRAEFVDLMGQISCHNRRRFPIKCWRSTVVWQESAADNKRAWMRFFSIEVFFSLARALPQSAESRGSVLSVFSSD